MTVSAESNGTKKSLATDATRGSIYSMDPENIVIPGVDNDDKPDDADKLYDERIEREVPGWLVDSIDDKGVLEPVLVRKTEDQIECVAGQFRIRACREANKRRKRRGEEPRLVPVLRKTGTTAELFELKIAENELRTDDPPLAKAQKAERFVTLFGKTEKDAAKVFGVDAQTVKAWRSLLTLPPKIQKAVESGRIASTSGVHLASIGDPEKQLAAFEEVLASAKGKPSVEEVAHKVRQTKRGTDEDDAAPPQSRRVLRKLVEAQAKGTIELDEAVIDTLRWVLGEITHRKINGLGPALRVLKLLDG